jgi:phenylacetyl-CoA:acceptor oxidoreductase subunit 2
MTRESYVAVALFAVGLVTVLVAPRSGAVPGGGALIWACAVLAAVYLFTQTRILAAARGIPAWREPALQPLMVVTGLTEGVGLMLVLAPVAAGAVAGPAAVLLCLCLLRGLAWLVYLRRIESAGVPPAACAVLRRASTGLIVVGHVLPILLSFLALQPWPWPTGLGVLAGVVALAAGWLLKYLVVTRAAYNQGFALPWTPVRGAGDAVAGPRPGWPNGGT